jgi:HEAT repeats
VGLFDRFTTPNLEVLKSKQDVKALMKALKHSNATIRLEAATALDDLGWTPSNNVEKSYYLLGKQQWNDLADVSEPAIELLDKKLNYAPNSSNEIKETASFLAEIGNLKAANELIWMLYQVQVNKHGLFTDDTREDIIQSIVQALNKIGKPTVQPLVDGIIQTGFTERGIEKKVPHPAMVLAGPSSDTIQFWHVSVVAAMGGLAFDSLTLALSDPNREIRRNAANALGMIGDPQATDALIQALTDSDWYVRSCAADALGKIGDPKAIEPLNKASTDSDWAVRSSVKKALKRIGN